MLPMERLITWSLRTEERVMGLQITTNCQLTAHPNRAQSAGFGDDGSDDFVGATHVVGSFRQDKSLGYGILGAVKAS
jgi:hypothetical protein